MRRFLLIALAVSGCVREFRPPPTQQVQLGTKVATFRTYAPGTICFAGRDYQPVLKGELTAMNELLAAFLQDTSAGAEGAWTPQNLELLDRAQTDLPAALNAHEATLTAIKDCLFEHKHQFPALARAGLDSVRQTRERLNEAPALLAKIRFKEEMAKWKEQVDKDRESERSNWCPPKLKPNVVPDVYFALEDESGRTEWLFCDGSKVVVSEPGKQPELQAPKEGRPPSKTMQANILKAAAKYPAGQIRHPPKPSSPPPAPAPAPAPAAAPAAGGTPPAGEH